MKIDVRKIVYTRSDGLRGERELEKNDIVQILAGGLLTVSRYNKMTGLSSQSFGVSVTEWETVESTKECECK